MGDPREHALRRSVRGRAAGPVHLLTPIDDPDDPDRVSLDD
jgi:hypothetical protein